MSSGCANITAPTGGQRDTIPPRLVSVMPQDSLLNTKIKKIELYFDEYITVSDAAKEVELSPMLPIAPSVTGLNKHVVVKIVDSLLEDSTTYTISFGSAVKDLHEGNPFRRYTYVFSTGPYFDSLQLQGQVIDAATGLPDSGGVTVELYGAAETDSAIVQHKPKYITKADAKGIFRFKGLPKRNFHIHALKDANGNYMYDGPIAGEMIAFNDSFVTSGDTSRPKVLLKIFAEIPDTADKKKLSKSKEDRLDKRNKPKKDEGLTYSVNVDTANVEKRSFDINQTINVTFNAAPVLNTDKIMLSYDSADVTIDPDLVFVLDSTPAHVLHIKTTLSENAVYTLRLAKGFAKDTSGAEIMPARFVFRTMDQTDYGKFKIHLPSKYLQKFKNTWDTVSVVRAADDTVVRKVRYRNPNPEFPGYVLKVTRDNDSVYQKPITDTIVSLSRLKPGKYIFRVVVDKNGNGQWDTGDLFEKIQPEEVIPYPTPADLKANWENVFDFEQKPAPRKPIKEKSAKPK
jgi:hypothetical protein